MPDKTYAKVVLNGTTYVDLTSDTVDSSTLLSGYTAHNRSGELITGSFDTSIFVLKAGDTMTGYLTLNGNPTSNLHAVTKQYVDNKFIKNTGEDYMHGSYVITDSDSLLEGTELVTLNKNYILLEENNPESHSESPYTKIHKSYIQVKKAFYDDGFLDESYGTEIAYDGITIEDSVHNLPSYKSVLNNNALHIYTDTNLTSEISDYTLKINGHDLLKTTRHLSQAFSTLISANANLNTSTYTAIGTYYVSNSSTAASFNNCPTSTPFTMYVEAPINSSETNTGTYIYRVRHIITYAGDEYIQRCYISNVADTWTFGTWYKLTLSNSSSINDSVKWLEGQSTRLTSLDITHNNSRNAPHMRLDASTSSLTGGVNSIFGEGYVLTYMWDTTSRWDTQFYLPTADGNVPAYRAYSPSTSSWSSVVPFIVGYTAGNLQVNTTGASLTEGYCKQYGKTVNVRVFLSGLSTSTQTHSNVITVQLVTMPSTNVRFICTCWNGNNIASYAGYGIMETNGRITIVKSLTNSDKVSFEFTYNV